MNKSRAILAVVTMTMLLMIAPALAQDILLAEYTYDELSRVSSVTLGNGTQIDYEYDLANRITKVENHFTDGRMISYDYPDYDNVGNRLKMVVDGTADHTDSVSVTVYKIEVNWEAYPGNPSLHTFIDVDGVTRKGIFPGKTGPDDVGFDRNFALVEARIVPEIKDIPIYLEWFDVDDPSDSDIIDTNGDAGNDNHPNYGTGFGVPGQEVMLSEVLLVTDNNGKATVPFLVSMVPGDNFRIAAALNAAGGNALSDTLVVRRKLWIERDSMAVMADSGPERNYVTGEVTGYEIVDVEGSPLKRTRIYLDVNFRAVYNRDFYDDNQFSPGKIIINQTEYPNLQKSGNTLFGMSYVEITNNLIENPPPGSGTGSPDVYELFDDDHLTVGGQGPIQLPQLNIEMNQFYTNEFRRAYLEPVYLDSQYSDIVPFDRNVRDVEDVTFGIGTWNNDKDLQSTHNFWHILLVTAFQGERTTDVDGDTTSEGGVTQISRNESLIYLEILDREINKDRSTVIAHEIGHTGNLDHDDDVTCLMHENAPTGASFCDQCIKAMRNQSTW